MRRHSARLWPRLAVLALSMSLLGCGPSIPPAQTPDEPLPRSEARPAGDQGQAAIPRAFASGNSAAPLDLRSDAPPPDSQPQGNALMQPDQPSMTLDDLQGGIPREIPQAMAGALLRPLQGSIADVRAPGLPPGVQDGCAYGALPDLLDYDVYPRLLYYPYRSVWVPYILVNDCYYPYVYQPYFQPLLAGYCYYPLFVYRRGFYYPYYFHSRAYYYGYLDWEYNWPRYRDRHHDYDWDDIGRRRPRRYNDDDFDDWKKGKIKRHERVDWQRAEPPRKRPKGDRADRPRLDRDEQPERRDRAIDAERREKQPRPKGQKVRAEQGPRKERLKGERPDQVAAKPPKKEGKKGRVKGERRAQSDLEDEEGQETLD